MNLSNAQKRALIELSKVDRASTAKLEAKERVLHGLYNNRLVSITFKNGKPRWSITGRGRLLLAELSGQALMTSRALALCSNGAHVKFDGGDDTCVLHIRDSAFRMDKADCIRLRDYLSEAILRMD